MSTVNIVGLAYENACSRAASHIVRLLLVDYRRYLNATVNVMYPTPNVDN